MDVRAPSRRWTAAPAHLGVASVSALAVLAGFVVWQCLGRPAAVVVSDLVPLPVEALAVWVSWRAARRTGGRAWRIVAAAYLLYLIGDATWAFLEVVRHRSPFPSVADVWYLLFYPVLMAGLLSFPSRPRRRAETARLAMDVATVVVASSVVVWYYVIGPTVRGVSGVNLSAALSLAYPVGDVVLLFAVAAVLLRGTSSDVTAPLRILIAGVAAFVVADVGFAHLSLTNAYRSGTWPDTLWLAAVVLLVVSADCRPGSRRVPRPSSPVPPSPRRRVALLPYLAVAGGNILLLAVGLRHSAYPVDGLLLGGFALTGLVIVRQIMAMRDNAALMQQFHRAATLDPLTGIANRRCLFEAADLALAEAHRDGSALSLIVIDVDRFKTINDTLGHPVGDEALRFVAGTAGAQLRGEDLLARVGGDEFAALLPGVPLEQASVVAERIVTAVGPAGPEQGTGRPHTSVSIGVAEVEDCGSVDAALRRADAALYQAKQAGRGCVRAARAGATATASCANQTVRL